jgi:hypothetical protein
MLPVILKCSYFLDSIDKGSNQNHPFLSSFSGKHRDVQNRLFFSFIDFFFNFLYLLSYVALQPKFG